MSLTDFEVYLVRFFSHVNTIWRVGFQLNQRLERRFHFSGGVVIGDGIQKLFSKKFWIGMRQRRVLQVITLSWWYCMLTQPRSERSPAHKQRDRSARKSCWRRRPATKFFRMVSLASLTRTQQQWWSANSCHLIAWQHPDNTTAIKRRKGQERRKDLLGTTSQLASY